MSAAWSVVPSTAALAVNAYTFTRYTLPDLKDTHRQCQEWRRKCDGYAASWWMCWTYWIGVDRLVFGNRKKSTP